jgi:hypothetical protein
MGKWSATKHTYTCVLKIDFFGQKLTLTLSFQFDVVEFIEYMLHTAGDLFVKAGTYNSHPVDPESLVSLTYALECVLVHFTHTFFS